MTSPPHGSPSLALVLGGGGAVGVGWQTGVLTGLRDAGVDLSKADAIVGTSAGALVGAFLSSGRDVNDALRSLAALGQSIDPQRLASGNDAFLRAMRTANLSADRRQVLRAIGHAAAEASTPPKEVYLGLFGKLDGVAWPAAFRCTAIDIDTGDLAIWDEGADVTLLEAVASSCVLPMLFPILTINGHRYMDGGILSHLNATAAPATDVLLVLSCHPIASRPGVEGLQAASASAAAAEVARLRATTRVIAVEPDFGGIQTENRMMDPKLALEALQIGRRQAEREVAVIKEAWKV